MDWPAHWRGRWIWDRAPPPAHWWQRTEPESHFVYLRRTFVLADLPASLGARVTCDSRYRLFLNGTPVGRGPVRGEPEFLGWDEYELADKLRIGANVLVALCRYYGQAGPWWVPAPALGTLGRGSFCFETAPGSEVELLSDGSWRAVPAPWEPGGSGNMHAFPSEVIEGRRAPRGLHDAAADEHQWPAAVLLSGYGHGTVLDRPPAAPYMTPRQRPIPQMRSRRHTPKQLTSHTVAANPSDDPVETWSTVELDSAGGRRVSVWDVGRLCRGYVELAVVASPRDAGSCVDVVVGEDLRADGLPEIAPRNWAGRYLVSGDQEAPVSFFDPVGFRYLAVLHPSPVEVSVTVEESGYPYEAGASFECDEHRYTELFDAGVRTIAACSADAFLDCPGREQRAWVADAYVQILVALIVNPDLRLVRHHLELTARSRFHSGLLAGAAACDFARIGFTMPEYSLHWIRSLYAYWWHSGDEAFVRRLLAVADAIIDRYEQQRGASGLLEDFPGWVFLDWAQTDRDTVTAAHDALYVAALRDYAELPGAADVDELIGRTTRSFEALWDRERQLYVDAVGTRGLSRRISQHTNAAALLARIVPEERIEAIIERIIDPANTLGGRLVMTATPADFRAAKHERIPSFQYQPPENFDSEVDVVAAQPWFCRFLHEALTTCGRPDLVLASLARWRPQHGTLQEFWEAPVGTSSRCHGWSASPTYDLAATVLGVSPAVPGYARAIINPFLGPLTRAAGRVSTPHGWLSVAVDGDEVQVDVPPGMVAEIAGDQMGRGIHRRSISAARSRVTS